jgi:hypothetical protein
MILTDEDRLQSLNGWARKDPFFRIAASRKAGNGMKGIMQDRERRRGQKKSWLAKSSGSQSASP